MRHVRCAKAVAEVPAVEAVEAEDPVEAGVGAVVDLAAEAAVAAKVDTVGAAVGVVVAAAAITNSEPRPRGSAAKQAW